MANTLIDDFMALFPGEGLTFDDVSMYTRYADFLPDEASVKSAFSRNVALNVPFVSAAMDTVTEGDMAIAMAFQGGIGVLHKNLSPSRQADEARRVKSYLNGLIENPVTFDAAITVRALLDERQRRNYTFSGFPIVDDAGKLAGILTQRDLKFVSDYGVPVSEIMTRNVVTAPVGTSLEQAHRIMATHKVGKLPIIDAAGHLAGLYSFHDVKSLMSNRESHINRDAHYKLRVAAAVSPFDWERAEKLIAVGTDALVVDTAHGHSKGVIETVRELKRRYTDTDIVAGNVADAEGAIALLNAGADAIKVGIGPGSICTTRMVCGVGIPQLTAIYDVYRAIGHEVPIIGDGGIKYSGDVPKGMAVGASAVMMGSVLAGTQESPGEKILHQGRTFVVYRGMGSVEAMKSGKGSRERYGHADVDDSSKLVPQGVEGLVPFRGTVEHVLGQFTGGLRFSLGYTGARNIDELRKRAKFVRVSMAGLREAHAHDIKIIKDAPNYSTSSGN